MAEIVQNEILVLGWWLKFYFINNNKHVFRIILY